jgi:hypothetical protein
VPRPPCESTCRSTAIRVFSGPDQAILRAMDPLVELLDRQVDFLLRQTDSAAFLIQVEPFLRALRAEPRLAAYLDDVLEEVVHIVDAMERSTRGSHQSLWSCGASSWSFGSIC